MRTVVSVSLPEDLASELDRVAKEVGMSKSSIIKNALKAYLWEIRFMKLREIFRPEAEAQGLLTDEDVFKVVF